MIDYELRMNEIFCDFCVVIRKPSSNDGVKKPSRPSGGEAVSSYQTTVCTCICCFKVVKGRMVHPKQLLDLQM